MSFYIIRIKGKWTIRQPLGSNIYMIKYFMTFIKIKSNIILFLKLNPIIRL